MAPSGVQETLQSRAEPARSRYHAGMRPRVLGMSIALAIGLVTAGCGDGCGRGKTKTNQPAARDAGPKPKSSGQSLEMENIQVERKPIVYKKPPPLPQLERLRLDDAGKAPRRALRYRPVPAAKSPGQSAAAKSSMLIRAKARLRELKDGTWGPHIELPEMRYGLDIEIDSSASSPAPGKGGKSPAYQVRLRGLLAEIGELPEGTEPKLAKHAKQGATYVLDRYRTFLERRRLSMAIDPRGLLGELTLSPDLAGKPEGEGTRRQVYQLLVESVVPLPEKPIGVGARWTAVINLWRDNNAVTQTAEYQLTGVEKNRLQITAKLTQIGQHQIIEEPGLPSAITAELMALFWQAKGPMEIDLTSLTPISATLTIEMRVHNRVIAATRVADRIVESTGTVTIGPGPAKKPAKAE